jgi:hypothetical protein
MKQSKANSSKLYQPYFNHHYNTNRNRNQWPIQKLGDNFGGGKSPGRPVRLAADVENILLGETGEFRSLKHSKLLPGEGPAAGPWR